jgi:hypothetical protein
MYALGLEIIIKDAIFRRVHDVQIEKSTKTIGATATIKIPATARLERLGEFITEVETAKTFDRGDAVLIYAGYNGARRLEFQGYVSRVKPGIPVEITCEDALFLLRRRNLQASFRSITLKSLLEYILQGTFIRINDNVPGITFSPFYLRNVSAASALQKLKEEYGLTMYFRSISELYVGLESAEDATEVKYRIGENVIDNNLTWRDEDDVRLRIKAVHIKKDNTRVEKETGDSDGELRTLFFYNLPAGADLETIAKDEMGKYKYTGYEGSLTGFLLPNVEPGNVIALEDRQFDERNGKYLADKVTTSLSTSGARRTVELGLKVG